MGTITSNRFAAIADTSDKISVAFQPRESNLGVKGPCKMGINTGHKDNKVEQVTPVILQWTKLGNNVVSTRDVLKNLGTKWQMGTTLEETGGLSPTGLGKFLTKQVFGRTEEIHITFVGSW